MLKGKKDSILIGVAHILFAWLCLTVAFSLTRNILPHSNLAMLLFFLNFISFVLILPGFIFYGTQSLKTSEWRMILVRTVFGISGFAFVFLAVQKTSLVKAVLLNNAAPLYVPVLLWLWLRKSIDHKLWPGIALGFMGVILILKPRSEEIAGFLQFDAGNLFALGAGLFLALGMIAMRVLLKSEKIFTVLFYYFLFGTLLTFPFALSQWVTPSQETIWLILAFGVLGLVGQVAFLRAFRFGKASQLSPFVYSSVVYAGLIDWLFYHRLPHFYFLIGVILIVMGGIWAIIFSKPKVL